MIQHILWTCICWLATSV